MPKTKTQGKAQERLRNTLEKLEGVRRAIIAEDFSGLILVCEASARLTIERAAQAVLADEGFAPGAVNLEVAFISTGDVQRRVRYVSTKVDRPRANFSRATTVLEWQDREYVGTYEGEGGVPVELRVCALATIDALQQIMGHEVTFQLVGVKAIRIFDHDLVAALLHSPQAADRRLIGSSLVLDDINRSASLAVLNATNRLLGNYLATE